eukprot:s2379_g13.t3
MGYIVPEYYKFPGYLSPSLGLKFSDVPNGLAALSKLPVLGGAQIIAFAGLIETTGFFQAASTTDGRGPREGQFSMKDSTETGLRRQDPNKEAGDFGDPLGLGQYNEEFRNKARSLNLSLVGFPWTLMGIEQHALFPARGELNNGRFAMFAAIGIISADLLTGKDAIQQFG